MSYKKFILLYLCSLLAIGVIFAPILFVALKYLSLMYEHNPYTQIVKRQIEKKSIYGTALNENNFTYRLEMIKYKKPEIVILGSSRAGLFREIYFNTSMIAATNGANTLGELEAFAKQMLAFHQPKIVFINLDPWWFIRKMPNYSYFSYQKLTGNDITAEKIKDIFYFFIKNKIPLSTRFFHQDFISNPYTPYDSLGLRAIVNSDGSFYDGSTMYASTIYGLFPSKDEKFQDTLSRIQRGLYPFYYSQNIEEERIEQFERILNLLKEKNIHVITYIAPVAPAIYREMNHKYAKEYHYLLKVNEYAKKMSIFNFFDANQLMSNDCEFYDGFHGGDVAYARMLLKISQSDFFVKKYIDIARLNKIIEKKKNHAFALEIANHRKEIDFLRLGCKKDN